MSDPAVQMATIIYNDRVNSWNRMKQLDKVLDDNPTEDDVADMAETRIRNLQGFAELRSLNDTGKLLYKHPLIEHESEVEKLKQLYKKNPLEFLEQYNRCKANIKRYRSYVKSTTRKDKRVADKAHLDSYINKERIYKNIILDGKE